MADNEDKFDSIDIRGIQCPYTFIKAKLMLEKMGVGETLNILLNNETALKNLPRAFMYHGQEVVGIEKINTSDWLIRIRKRR